MSWKVLASVAVCLLAASSLGTAADVYDEIPPEDMHFMYQEHNYIDQGPDESPGLMEDDMRRFLLYKMLSSFRNQDVSPNVLAGPKWIPSGTLMHPETIDLQLQDGIMKRIPNNNGQAKVKAKGPAKPAVPKLKNSKGRGPQGFCLFKVCTYRTPSILLK